jgi:hypothetical protein
MITLPLGLVIRKQEWLNHLIDFLAMITPPNS